MSDKNSPLLQELSEVVPLYESLGFASALLTFSNNSFDSVKDVRRYFSMTDDAMLEKHKSNPYIFRETQLKRVSDQDLCIVTVVDFQYQQFMLCSSSEKKIDLPMAKIMPVKQRLLERYETWFKMVFEGEKPPKFM